MVHEVFRGLGLTLTIPTEGRQTGFRIAPPSEVFKKKALPAESGQGWKWKRPGYGETRRKNSGPGCDAMVKLTRVGLPATSIQFSGEPMLLLR